MTNTEAQYHDEWLLDVPLLREFIEQVNEVRQREPDPQKIVAAIRPHFAKLLADQSWLPDS
ncbi:MAG: hypothetical protein KDE58_22005, partial [Caldilineaceae bacterium]|nr:hypothetical protein [Caldilineaceae bacterium]